MNKARTAKMLSAAAVANMAAVGFAVSPASAATHTPAATAGGTAARALRAALAGGALNGNTAAVSPRGFVPRASSGVKPDTETGCNSYLCVGLYGGGNFVSYFNAHWFAGSPSSPCRTGAIGYTEPNGYAAYHIVNNVCYKQQIQVNYYSSYPTGTKFCAAFSGFPGSMCEPVR
jgi:hypothetical protein